MPDEPLLRLDSDLWVVRRPLKLVVGDIGARMTVVRIGSQLLLHSPIPYDPVLGDVLDDLGDVQWVVAPSNVHHLYVGEWIDAYPCADLCGTARLAEKRPDLTLAHALGDEPVPEWRDHLAQHAFAGAPRLGEVVFLHIPSRTLLLTDLAFNVPLDGPDRARVFHWLVGARGRFGPHRLVRAMIRDRDAARRSLEHVLAWDFDRIIVSHGEVLETGGREQLREAFAFLTG